MLPANIGAVKDLDFDDMALFVRVATRGTLSAVARERNVPVSQISRSLSRIEKQCGVRLVQRSTQGLSLTAEGQTFLGYCQRITGTLEELEAEFAHQTREVSGTVQVAVSPALGHFIMVPSLGGLYERHPRLQIELHSDDRLIDMALEGVDITLRSGATHTESMMARQIGHHGRALYASPAYLERFGMPTHPDELLSHRLITNSAAQHLNRWPFIIDGMPIERPVQGHYRANSTGIMMTMVLNDLGICRCNTLIAAPLVAQGRLLPVLEDWVDVQDFPIHALLVPQRHHLPKIQACLAYWSEWFQALLPSPT